MPPWYMLLFIFCARILDVSIGTVRTICMVRGFKRTAIILGFFEVTIWVLAVQYVLRHVTNPLALLAYGFGFSTGIWVGMLIEKRLALGNQAVRAIVREPMMNLAVRLRSHGYTVTRVEGEGRDGPVEVDFIIIPRRQVQALMDLIFNYAPHAMVTVEDLVDATTEELRLLKRRGTMLERLVKIK